MDIEQRIKELEDEIKRTQYNKATEKHILRLKARIAYLKKELEEKRKKQRAQRSSRGVKKFGDAMVSLIGPPSVGKSLLFNKLTNAKSEVGDYAFTTLEIYPGIMKYNGAEIQLLDMPGLIEGASKGRGKGREILSVARNSDLLLIMVDVFNHNLNAIIEELYSFGIRINQDVPKVSIKRKDKGGINVASTMPLSMDEDTIKSIVREFGYVNVDILIKEDITPERLVDFFAGNRVYVHAVLVINKVDLVDKIYLQSLRDKFSSWEPVFISAKTGEGLEELKEKIFYHAGLIRVYLKPQNGNVDYNAPLILKKGATIEDICKSIHRDFIKKFRYAMVWGNSVKFPGQHVGLEHRVEDEDIVRLVLRR